MANIANGKHVRIVDPTAGDYDCRANDPSGRGLPARSIIADGTVNIEDGGGEQSVLPDLGPWQWVGFDVATILEASTTATAVVVIW